MPKENKTYTNKKLKNTKKMTTKNKTSNENFNATSHKTDVICSTLKEGDIIEIRGYYFDWVVKYGYSELLKKEGLYAVAQGGLIHSELEGDRILRINGNSVV